MNKTMHQGTSASVPSEAAVAERVEALLGQMSLAEKVGQLTQIGGAPWNEGPKPEDIIRQGGAGSVPGNSGSNACLLAGWPADNDVC